MPEVPIPEMPVEHMSGILQWIVDFVHHLGYLGIFIMTFVESTFVPIPAEITMVPAGYLIFQGKMDVWLVMLSSVAGTIGGSLFNYWIAYHYGRRLFIRYGKYFFMNEAKLQKIEDFFTDHGPASVFSGRLIPGLRHFISFPAGLARMNLRLFCLYTGVGGAIWMGTLLALGYFIGHEEEHLKASLSWIVGGMLVLLVIGGIFYVRRHRRKKNGKSEQ